MIIAAFNEAMKQVDEANASMLGQMSPGLGF